MDTSDFNISFKKMLDRYKKVQSNAMKQVKCLSEHSSGVNPAKFLMAQFQMAKVTQVGESISNMISQVNSLINASVRNQKTQ